MSRTSAPHYYQVADRNLRSVHGLPFDWHGGDNAPVVRFSLDRDSLLFIEACIRQFEPRDGFAGEIQAVRERVDQIIASELNAVEGDMHEAASKVRALREHYGVTQ